MSEENQVNEGTVNTPQDTRKGFSITSMVLGIVSLVLFCVWYASIPCGILAIIFGIIGKKRAGRGMAIAGLVTGLIAIVLYVACFVLLLTTGITIGFLDGMNSL